MGRQFNGKVLLLCIVLALCTTNAAQSATLTLLNGNLTVSLIANANPFAVQAFDVRGPAILEVNSPGPIAPVLLTDQGAPFPNSVLLADDGGNQQLNIAFDLNTLVLGAQIFIDALGTPVGTVTDPELLALQQRLQFSFTLVTAVSQGPLELLTFNFTSAQSIPEPESWQFLGLGLLALSAIRLRRRLPTNR